MDPATLFVGFMLGTIGTAYFVWGKKENNAAAMLSGFLLIALPYFIPNLWVLGLISLLLMAAPVLLARLL